ncbi:BON domain-containing protein [Planctomyces sp. SH-PL62]|uniref:BON domain-containing protein n=1 Tax=Planctomyces sp. SH-PL62 TaxID=1636152 RepID=UPI0018D47A45|nr:BON domain-containing protein [Planctomyces sp. SH-PL62]
MLGLMAVTAPMAMGQATNPNQVVADSVAGALRTSRTLASTRIEIEAQGGLVTLSGVAASPEIKSEALSRAQRVAGVTGVVDHIQVGDQAVRPAQYVPQQVAMGGHGGGHFGHGGVVGGGPVGMGEGVVSGPGAGPGGFVNDGGPLPEGPAGGAAGGAVQNQPNYAWPSYAPPGNFSAVGYPTAYPWQAWPNIGPFYPYPEVPLDWRAVTLRWDDGIWWLDFKKNYTRPFFTPYPFGIFAY